MSYTSFKRVLGETSLERKCRFMFGACLLVLITCSFWWYGMRTELLVYQNTRNTGRALVNPIMVQLHWGNAESESLGNPNAAQMTAALSKEWETENFTYEIFNHLSKRPDRQPVRDLDRANYDRLKTLQLYPNDTEQTLDPMSGEIKSIKESYREERATVDDKYQYSYYQPIFAKKNCLGCHQNLGIYAAIQLGTVQGKPLAVGDFMGVVKVTLPDSITQDAINFNRAVLLATAIITVFLAMVVAYVIVRYIIVKPLQHLRDVSDEVSRGQFDARANIQTGDEFEELAKAFNKMLRHLVSSQEDLRQANINLDLKVDELAQLNMRLYEMNRLKSDFLATMSHELRTPLNSIIGFSDVLSGIKNLEDKQRRYVQNIQKSGRMLLDMINDILDLAKIESGKMELKPTEFTIEQVVQTQSDMARPLAERKNIDLLCELEPDLPPLFQDVVKVQQILNNLLSNAIKFTPEGGRIIVSAKRDEETGDLLLSVIDNGVGISVDDQTAIFEKFRQGAEVLARGDAMTREYSGTGLGLSIVKELCKLLGGEIQLKSELGQGSTFTVQLPWSRPVGDASEGVTGLGKLPQKAVL